jgi:small subunit ribosomal protein S1
MQQITEENSSQPKKEHPLTRILKANPQLTTPLKDGDTVEATLLTNDLRRAYFDLGGKGTGVVFGIEFTNARDVLKGLKPGDTIHATVLVAENDEGYTDISLTKAMWQKSWQEIRRMKDEGELRTVKIIGANTGGLVTELNSVKAFIPVSQLSTENYPHVEDGSKNKILEELKKFVGKEMEVKVLDFNPKNEKLILSQREVTGENVKESLTKYAVGNTVEVIVSGVADFGVFVRFVDNPNIEGLVHISEIDHKLIDSPKEVVKVNDALRAQIIELKDGKVSLSFKALKPNPWDEAEKLFAVDQEVEGTVSKYNPFGALVALTGDLQGLIHISEFPSQEEMKKQLEVGKKYLFVITQVKPSEKRIILKLKKA